MRKFDKCVFVVLGIEPRDLCMLGQPSTPELPHPPSPSPPTPIPHPPTPPPPPA